VTNDRKEISAGFYALLPRLMGVVLGLSVLLAYANTLRVPFLFDDHDSIVANPTIRKLGFEMFSPPGRGLTVDGRPVLNASLALNYAVGGTDVRGYHAVNIAIHLLAALTLFGLVRRTLAGGWPGNRFAGQSTEIAAAAALFWALHPLQTESVTYIVQRTESLMGLFYLLTLYALVRGSAAGAPRGWMGVALAACALGMGTKEVMVSAPLMALLYDRTFVAGSFRDAWRQRRGFYLGLAATWLILGYLVAGSGLRGGTIGAAAGVTPWEYALCQARAIIHYLWLAIWPSGLIFDYGADFVSVAEAFPFVVLVLGLLGLTVYGLWRRPALGFLGLWFFVILAPTSSFVGGTRQMLAEHRMYLSLAALAVGGAMAVNVMLGRRGWLLWSALAAALGVVTVQRNADYRSAVSIYADTVAKRPGNAFAHNNLGQALLEAGETAEAVKHFETALRLSPGRPMAYNNLAGALAKLGRTAEAVENARAAVKLSPDYSEAHFNLGTALLRQGQGSAAILSFENAVRLQPGYAEAYCNLGAALLQAGRASDAVACYAEAVRLKRDYAEAHYGLGLARQQSGQWAAAVEPYETALQLRPDYAEANNNLGVVLLQLRRGPDAIRRFQAALSVRPDYVEAHNNLGRALCEIGRMPEAVPHFQAVLRLEPKNAAAHFNIGNVFSATGRAAQAIGHYEAAVQAEPNNAEYHNNLGGALFEGAGRVDEALGHFATALRLKPDSAETHGNLGVVLGDLGRRSEAIGHLETALRLRPDYAFAREQLARLRAGK
jgi:tetratricopeptide (TPR) repeat protein